MGGQNKQKNNKSKTKITTTCREIITESRNNYKLHFYNNCFVLLFSL